MTVALAAIGITKQFGALRAVADVTFTIEAGGIAALIGPNGAGKTTILNLICGALRPSYGRIELFGRDITNIRPDRAAAQGLLRTFQLVHLFPRMSAIENVATGFHLASRGGLASALLRPPAMRRQERQVYSQAEQMLAFVGLAERAADTAQNLPYGQQRLLEIARALAAHPRVLLLDEPAAGLNPAETRALGFLIRRIRDQGITVVFVEHDMNLVMTIAERIIVLNFGNKIAEGTPDEVTNNTAVRDAYLG